MTENILNKTVDALDHGAVPDWISAHVRRYQETGGREGHLWDSTAVGGQGLVPCLLLKTIGRKSGKSYVHPLLYGVDGDGYVIVGSKGGSDTHPQWYHNLLATPDVEVQVGPEVFAAHAQHASGDEHSRLWQLMTAHYPAYCDYQARTSRVIPLFSLKRRPV